MTETTQQAEPTVLPRKEPPVKPPRKSKPSLPANAITRSGSRVRKPLR